ncbi:ABC transporter substrate-binding protein [Cloacibacterium rupense]|uniref:ABC transporter substrate-binding protein n=1 Tax=Cloacibacterium rupense TaxID=517423 RepID=A0ABQ2NL26_9FLAO|nr:T9SS type A sorting domain-containing protein [Cloacibacterium rupense]GGP04349.1 ABC transporter substrate-binding protein [Cloacibacterium rupense]
MKKLFSVVLFWVTVCSFAQTQSSSKWSDLFSYNNVLAFKESNGKIIAATENGVFYYDTVSGEITKLSKANGLHEVKISAFDYNPDTKIALIGYKSGNLDVVTEDGVTYVVDIPLSQSYTGSKVINHISINGDKAVISVGYGVSIFDLNKKEFGDTCFFLTGTSYVSALESVIKDDVVYSVTSSGIKSHPLNVTFSVFSSWNTTAGNYNQIDSNSIFVLANTTKVFYGANINSLTTIADTFVKVKDIKVQSQNIVVTDQTKVYVYNLSGSLQKTFDAGEELNTAYIVSNKLYSGSKFSGVFDESKNSYKPDGPYSNVSKKVSLFNDNIWISSGGVSEFNLPVYSGYGYYHYDGTKWNYPDYFRNSTFIWNVIDVMPNPANKDEVFFTNYSTRKGEQGIYKMNKNSFVKAYAKNDVNAFYRRPVSLHFDENNQLFCNVAFADANPSNPTSLSIGYYYYNASADDFGLISVFNSARVNTLTSKGGILWIPSPNVQGGALVGYKYNNTPGQTGDDTSLALKTSNELPSDGVICATMDLNDDLWIGTYLGLRILPNASGSIGNKDVKVEPVIISQNGINEELFKDSKILEIEVDSGNQKWVSVEGGGVFYLSSNGETTINHFTENNSPLPNDNITGIKVDSKTGKVYFATNEGVVVYQGDVVNVTSNFGDVKVYPNPVITAQYRGNVKIIGLAEKTNIRITDAAGNVVHSAVARGGYYEWNLNNQRGIRVASGIYYVLMTNEDATDKATAKIAVVN